MWLIFLLVLPFGGLEILIIPALVWKLGPVSWHPTLFIAFAIMTGVAIFWAVRWYLRGSEERRSNPAACASWRWPKGLAANQFCAQLSLYLRMHGWRIVSSGVGARDRIEIVVRKDRWCVVLLCVGPDQSQTTDHDLARLTALRREAGASHAAILSPGRRRKFKPGSIRAMILATSSADDTRAVKLALGLS